MIFPAGLNIHDVIFLTAGKSSGSNFHTRNRISIWYHALAESAVEEVLAALKAGSESDARKVFPRLRDVDAASLALKNIYAAIKVRRDK